MDQDMVTGLEAIAATMRKLEAIEKQEMDQLDELQRQAAALNPTTTGYAQLHEKIQRAIKGLAVTRDLIANNRSAVEAAERAAGADATRRAIEANERMAKASEDAARSSAEAANAAKSAARWTLVAVLVAAFAACIQAWQAWRPPPPAGAPPPAAMDAAGSRSATSP